MAKTFETPMMFWFCTLKQCGTDPSAAKLEHTVKIFNENPNELKEFSSIYFAQREMVEACLMDVFIRLESINKHVAAFNELVYSCSENQ